jgi:hypothetical protein
VSDLLNSPGDAGPGPPNGVEVLENCESVHAAISWTWRQRWWKPLPDGADTMPFKSKAQRRKFAELLVKGEISEETYEEGNGTTGSAKLPERVRKSPRAKTKAQGKRRKS